MLEEADTGFFTITNVEGSSMAASIYLKDGDTGFHKFNTSDWDYRQYGCNHLMMWEAIKPFVHLGTRRLGL